MHVPLILGLLLFKSIRIEKLRRNQKWIAFYTVEAPQSLISRVLDLQPDLWKIALRTPAAN